MKDLDGGEASIVHDNSWREACPSKKWIFIFIFIFIFVDISNFIIFTILTIFKLITVTTTRWSEHELLSLASHGSAELIAQLDDPCFLYLDFFIDHLYISPPSQQRNIAWCCARFCRQLNILRLWPTGVNRSSNPLHSENHLVCCHKCGDCVRIV